MGACSGAIRWPGQLTPFTCQATDPHTDHRDGDQLTWELTWTDQHPYAFRIDPATGQQVDIPLAPGNGQRTADGP